MKVPRIKGQVTVITPDNRAGKVVSIFFTDRTFIADCSGEGVLLSFDDYRPAAIAQNFLWAIDQWDYHYRASDDSRIYEEGKEYEAALIELFRQLPQEDQHNCRKIVEIVVMSTTPK